LSDTIRVLTWNIHGAFGHNPRFDLMRVVELIDRWGPHVVALQEVDSRRDRTTDAFDFLQRELGDHGIGARSITTTDGDYGQMLVSRWPMSDTEIHDLSYPECEPRRAIATLLNTPHGSLRVVSTHLGLSVHERRSQTDKLVRIVGNDAPTTVVMGDFNDWLWAGSVRSALAKIHFVPTSLRTFPSKYPMLRLDRIYCRPSKALRNAFTDPTARDRSDHLPVIADISLAPL
jgi:endonuclease/exonuclease/phosphatase family metal-dependent hydrolase